MLFALTVAFNVDLLVDQPGIPCAHLIGDARDAPVAQITLYFVQKVGKDGHYQPVLKQ